VVHARPVYRPGLRRRLRRTVGVPAALARTGLFRFGRPIRTIRQLALLREWGTSLAGVLMSATIRDPRRAAIVDDRGTLTYAEVDARTDRLAAALMSERVGPRPRIGVLCRNHRGMVESLVASSKRGAEVVLLNTGFGEAQMRAVLRELRVDVLVADAEFQDVLARAPRSLRRITAWADDSIGEPEPSVLGPGYGVLGGGLTVRPPSGPSLEELIADTRAPLLEPPNVHSRPVFLSSGTTGRPKGARRHPRPGIGSLATLVSRIPLRVHDTMVVEAPLFHTWGYGAMQMCFALRGTLVLRRRFDPEATLASIAAHRRVAVFAVPIMARRILDLPPEVRADYDTSSLRLMALSGSPLLGDLATSFMNEYGNCLYNLYGSTEVSWVTIATPRDLRADPATAGRPPMGTTVAIAGRKGRPAKRGVTGRIFAANELLFEGYTSGTPLDTWNGLMATGDLGHLDKAGRLRVDGREDDLVVSGGENILPRDVEDLLARLPEVADVVVRGVDDREYGQRLAAYIVVAPGRRLDAETVRGHVRDQYARYAVPREVMFLDELPRNATGKVVTRWLPPLVDKSSNR
jgi:acyl-CoA synthetase (AMP-forming)/AMP-acid ligase II